MLEGLFRQTSTIATDNLFNGGKVIATPGNLLELSANNKTCKTTYLTSGFIAASFGLEGDTLGIKSENPNNYALVHFDTEQSPFINTRSLRLHCLGSELQNILIGCEVIDWLI